MCKTNILTRYYLWSPDFITSMLQNQLETTVFSRVRLTSVGVEEIWAIFEEIWAIFEEMDTNVE